MFCPNCGNQNPDTAVFCESCGTKLVAPAGVTPDRMENIQDVSAAPQYRGKKRFNKAPKKQQSATQPKEKKSISFSKGTKFILGEILVLIVLFLAVFLTYRSRFSPKAVAERYMEALMDEEWSEAYSYLYTADFDDPMLTKESYVTAQELNANNLSKAKLREVKVSSSSFKSAKVRVKYKLDGETTDRKLTLKRSGLFWKVEDEDLIFRDLQIQVPKGASLTLDGVDVTNLVSKEEAENGYELYQFDEIFGYAHFAVVTDSELGETKEYRVYDTDKPDTPWKIAVKYSEEAVQAASEQALIDFDELTEAAIANKAIDDLACYQNIDDEDYKELVESSYDNYKKYTFDHDSSYYSVPTATVKNMEVEAYAETGSDYELPYVIVYLTYDFAYTEEYKGFSSTSTYDYSNERTSYFYYINVDGNWQLTGCGL